MITDPGQTNNLAVDATYAALLAQHRDLLAQWLANTDETHQIASPLRKLQVRQEPTPHL